MMLVWVLVVTALLVSDVAGMDNSTEVEETLRTFGTLKKGRCENGWYEYQPTKSCYRCFTTSKKWRDAEIFCNTQRHFGNLASVTSCDHNEFISKVVRAVTRSIRPVWIGLKDYCKNGNFLWSDESTIRYLNWGEGSPVSPNYRYYCAYTNYRSRGVWRNVNCNTSAYYVCAYVYH
ncbi:snaclec coagulation factor IX/factor X-binding protein subunit B3-like [Mobula birostris]|uniref:snaclec coagulation factor IX/factor X-binding protein subunit B3-like n=1 Tax=Mobula birostris TaxID=1983395 RepID=UPI003B28072C